MVDHFRLKNPDELYEAYTILVIDERNLRQANLLGAYRTIAMAHHVIVRNEDGTFRTLKDRYKGGRNTVKIGLPS